MSYTSLKTSTFLSLHQLAACSVKVTYSTTRGAAKTCFEILTNKSWDDFYSEICTHLYTTSDGPPTGTQLAYRLCDDGIYSNYSPLIMELDWCLAMMKVCRKKGDSSNVEINILKLKKPVSKSLSL